MSNKRGFQVQGLGEIAIRCREMEPMVRFYQDTIGLEILSGNNNSDIVFFRISEGCAGHTTVLALFAEPASGETSTGTASQQSTLHHLALSLPFAEQNSAMAWYREQELEFEVRRFEWIGWRGVFTKDPEGNVVELVAFDPDWNGCG